MSNSPECQSFYIKVEGPCHSTHRNPQGVYKIEVIKEKTLRHSACAALQVARDSVPFLSESANSFVLRAYSQDGEEIIIPKALDTLHDHLGIFQGRANDCPEIITLQ